MPAKLTDEVSPVPRPARRRRPPYPGGISRHQPKPPSGRLWRDLIIAKNDQRTSPYPHCCQRQRRKRYKRSPEPTTFPAAPIPRSQHRQICTYPPRAKGSLNRRFEWFSLVTFFLQKKKVTRAGARNVPSRARRRHPPYPGGISRHQPKPPSERLWRDLIIAKNDQRTSPYPHCISGSGAGIISRPGASVSFVSDGPISSNSGRNGGKNAGRNCVSALPQRAIPP